MTPSEIAEKLADNAYHLDPNQDGNIIDGYKIRKDLIGGITVYYQGWIILKKYHDEIIVCPHKFGKETIEVINGLIEAYDRNHFGYRLVELDDGSLKMLSEGEKEEFDIFDTQHNLSTDQDPSHVPFVVNLKIKSAMWMPSLEHNEFEADHSAYI